MCSMHSRTMKKYIRMVPTSQGHSHIYRKKSDYIMWLQANRKKMWTKIRNEMKSNTRATDRQRRRDWMREWDSERVRSKGSRARGIGALRSSHTHAKNRYFSCCRDSSFVLLLFFSFLYSKISASSREETNIASLFYLLYGRVYMYICSIYLCLHRMSVNHNLRLKYNI